MKSLQVVGGEIWSTLWHLVPGRRHKRATLAYDIARLVLERPNFFDRQYFAEVGEDPELLANAETVLIVLKVLATLDKHS